MITDHRSLVTAIAEIVGLLLFKGADAALKTSRGKTAFDLAKVSGVLKVVELLGKPAK